jgi:hypothetical protein
LEESEDLLPAVAMKGQRLDENVECEIQAQALTCESKRFDLPLRCVNSGFERLGVFRAERFDIPLGCVYSGFESWDVYILVLKDGVLAE